MIWSYWPTRKLQHLVGDEFLDHLKIMLPELDESGKNIFFENDKEKLSEIAASFVDEKYFRSKKNIEECLNHLPDERFFELCEALSYKFENRDAATLSLPKYIQKKKPFQDFISHFGLSDRFLPQNSSKPAPFEVCDFASVVRPLTLMRPFKRLKDYQAVATNLVNGYLSAPNQRVVLQMPTGSGKTRTAMEIIADFFISEEEPATILWLANSSELCEQAVQAMAETWGPIGNKRLVIQRLWGDFTEELKSVCSESQHNFLVASLQTMRNIMLDLDQNLLDYHKIKLVVVDEAHISTAVTYRETIETILENSKCRLLGLTATPGRSDEDETSELSSLYFENLVRLQDPTGKHENAIEFLRAKKILSQASYEPIKSNYVIKVKDSVAEDGNLSEKLLKDLGASSERLLCIVKSIRPYLTDSHKIILFAPSKSSSAFLSKLFTYLGYKSEHVDGNTNPNSRREIIERFNAGELQIICNYGVLATGFDSPKIDVVCIARPTFSKVLYSQMIGRGLRGEAVGGTANCKILEVIDTFEGMDNEAMLFNTFDEYWS